MRINIPAFRLPETVLDEEIGYIVNMGVTMKYESPVTSLKSLVEALNAVKLPTADIIDIIKGELLAIKAAHATPRQRGGGTPARP